MPKSAPQAVPFAEQSNKWGQQSAPRDPNPAHTGLNRKSSRQTDNHLPRFYCNKTTKFLRVGLPGSLGEMQRCSCGSKPVHWPGLTLESTLLTWSSRELAAAAGSASHPASAPELPWKCSRDSPRLGKTRHGAGQTQGFVPCVAHMFYKNK